MKSKIKFGIIGCSLIAKKSTIPAIITNKNSIVEMIGSRSITKAEKFAKEFDCNKFGNYEDVLKNKNIDAVYISLPISIHEKWAIKAAKAGKHILCEKSLTLSYASAKKIVKECKNNNVKIRENFVFKFHPQHKKILDIITKNKIGTVHSFSAKYGFNSLFSNKNFRFNKKLGGGALNDIGCYLISACSHVFKDLPTSVFCNLEINKKFNIDYRGSILLTFSKNRTALVSFSYNDYFQSTYDIWGTRGLIRTERAFNVSKNMKNSIYLNQNDKIKKILISPANQFQLAIEDFCSKIKHNSNNNFEKEILNQALIMDAVRRSSSKNSVIKIKS
ncbi:MAG: dehydrogenase [Thaumarchaeota archaeon]|jgi:predicted dehydrogenase|nr:MAG: dehydrogenase [Nitrososphaerota archaeon]